MKIWMISLVAVFLGAFSGMGVTWWEHSKTEVQFDPVAPSGDLPLESAESDSQPRPKAIVVGGTEYNFGSMDKLSKGSHTFIIKNEGEAPLTLKEGDTTCKCTISRLDNGELAPGESAQVTLEWEAKSVQLAYQHSADIQTNDPQRLVLRLTVKGKITDVVTVHPPGMSFLSISTNETAHAASRILEYRSGGLELGEPEFSNADTAKFFDVKLRKLSAEEIAEEEDAKSGYALAVSLKPGLPLGAINQTISFPTNLPDEAAKTVRVPIQGQVVSDIRVMGGSNFKSKYNELWFGTVRRGDNANAKLRVFVKGPHRHNVRLRVGTIDPSDLVKAELGEPKPTSNGKALMYPLNVRVLTDIRTANRLGYLQSKSGILMLNSDHPQAKEVKVFVKFAITGG